MDQERRLSAGGAAGRDARGRSSVTTAPRRLLIAGGAGGGLHNLNPGYPGRPGRGPQEAVLPPAPRTRAAGAAFALLGPERTMLRSRLPVIAVSAARTG